MIKLRCLVTTFDCFSDECERSGCRLAFGPVSEAVAPPKRYFRIDADFVDRARAAVLRTRGVLATDRRFVFPAELSVNSQCLSDDPAPTSTSILGFPIVINPYLPDGVAYLESRDARGEVIDRTAIPRVRP